MADSQRTRADASHDTPRASAANRVLKDERVSSSGVARLFRGGALPKVFGTQMPRV